MAQRVAYLEAVIGADITSFRRGMRDARSEIGLLSETISGIGRVGRTMTFALTAPLAAAGGLATNAAADFDESMRNINSIASLTEGQFKDLSGRTADFGRSIREGPTAAADALYSVFSAGVTDTDQAFEVMEAGVRTAEAGLADLQTTTEALTAATLAYSGSNVSAQRASDVLTRTVQLGVGEMQDFASSMGLVITSAAGAGVEIEDLGANWAFLTQRGFNASRAATSLNAAITAMVKPTEAMQQAFSQLGVRGIEGALEKFGSLDRVIQEVVETTDGSQESINALFNRIRGARAVNAFMNDVEGWNNSMSEFHESLEGATERAWTEQMKSFNAQWDLMTSALEGVAIQIGQNILPKIRPLITSITDLLNASKDLNPVIVQMGLAFAGALAAAGPLLWLFGSMINPITLLVGGVSALAVAFATDFGNIRTTVTNVVEDIVGDLSGLEDRFQTFIDTLLRGPDAIEGPVMEGPQFGPQDGQGQRLEFDIEAGMTLSDIWFGNERVRATFADDDAFYEAAMRSAGINDPRQLSPGTVEIRTGANVAVDPVNFLQEGPLFDPDEAVQGIDLMGPLTQGPRMPGDALFEGMVEERTLGQRISEAFSEAFGDVDVGQFVGDLFNRVGAWIIDKGIPSLAYAFGRVSGQIAVFLGQALSAAANFFTGEGGKELGDGAVSLAESFGENFREGFNESMQEAGVDSPVDQLFTSIAGIIVAGAGVSVFGRLLMGQGFAGAITGTLSWAVGGVFKGGIALGKAALIRTSIGRSIATAIGGSGGGAAAGQAMGRGRAFLVAVRTIISSGLQTAIRAIKWTGGWLGFSGATISRIWGAVGGAIAKAGAMKTSLIAGLGNIGSRIGLAIGSAISGVAIPIGVVAITIAGFTLARPIIDDLTNAINHEITRGFADRQYGIDPDAGVSGASMNAMYQAGFADMEPRGLTPPEEMLSGTSWQPADPQSLLPAPEEVEPWVRDLVNGVNTDWQTIMSETSEGGGFDWTPLSENSDTALQQAEAAILRSLGPDGTVQTDIKDGALSAADAFTRHWTLAETGVPSSIATMQQRSETPLQRLYTDLEEINSQIREIKDGAATVSGMNVDVSFPGSDGGRAIGGPVMTGRSYVVGEHGPELFTPNVSGNIDPNLSNVVPAAGGGGQTVNYFNQLTIEGITDVDDFLYELDRRGIRLDD